MVGLFVDDGVVGLGDVFLGIPEFGVVAAGRFAPEAGEAYPNPGRLAPP